MNESANIYSITAEPYPLILRPDSTALLIVDMQREFFEPGGFGEVIGNKIDNLQSSISPSKLVLAAARKANISIYFTREGHKPDLSDVPESKLKRGKFEVGIGDVGSMGRMLVRGEPGNQIM